MAIALCRHVRCAMLGAALASLTACTLTAFKASFTQDPPSASLEICTVQPATAPASKVTTKSALVVETAP